MSQPTSRPLASYQGTAQNYLTRIAPTMPKRPPQRDYTRVALATSEVSDRLWALAEALAVRFPGCQPFTDADMAALSTACNALDTVANRMASKARSDPQNQTSHG